GLRPSSAGGDGGGTVAARAQPRAVEADHAPCGVERELLEAAQRIVEVLCGNPAVGSLEQQERFCPGRREAGDLGENERDLMSAVMQCALARVELDAAQERERHRRLLEATLARETIDVRLAKPARALDGLDLGDCARVLRRYFTGLALNPAH